MHVATSKATPVPARTIVRLPFEREILVDAASCRRCSGSGKVSGSAASGPRCFDCKGLGRVLTKDGADLFRAVCKLLGIEPVIDERRRVEPGFMRSMFAMHLRSGMTVRRSLNQVPRPEPMRVIDTQEALGSVRIMFADGSTVAVTQYAMFARELQVDEIDRAQVWMAQHIGRGAVSAGE